MKYFNVQDEPWVPVRSMKGDIIEVGLKEVILNAQNYTELCDPNPLNRIAQYRIILAIIHRALTEKFGRWNSEQKAEWLETGLPVSCLSEYLQEWYDRFWFFHPEHPFMQIQALAYMEETKDNIKPWSHISFIKASGNTPTLFDHSVDKIKTRIPVKQALQNMLGYFQFVPGGLVQCLKKSDNAGPLANSAACIPLGSQLSETLVLSLHSYKKESRDLPVWEQEPLQIDDLKSDPTATTGYNDRYTRLTRGVLWIPESDSNYVSKLLFSAGNSIKEVKNDYDPMVSYRKTKDGSDLRITFDEGRSIWRDLPSMLPCTNDRSETKESKSKPAELLENALDLLDHDRTLLKFLVAGLASDQAKPLRMRIEHTVWPTRILKNKSDFQELQLGFEEAEKLYRQFKMIHSELIANAMPTSESKETKKKSREIQERGPASAMYFTFLEQKMPEFICHIASERCEEAKTYWKKALVDAVDHSWSFACSGMGFSNNAAQAIGRAENKIDFLKNKLDRCKG